MEKEKKDFEIRDVSINRYDILVLGKEDPQFDEVKKAEGWTCIDGYAVSCVKIHMQGHMPISMQTTKIPIHLDEKKAKQILTFLDLKKEGKQ